MSLSATLDKASYAPGDTITLTVVSDKRITNTALDVKAGLEDFKVNITIQSGVWISGDSRVWNLKSDDGKTAVYTAVA